MAARTLRALSGEVAQTVATALVVVIMVAIICALLWPEKLAGGGLAVLAGVYLAVHMATSRNTYQRRRPRRRRRPERPERPERQP
jgi:hypothetical protein